MPKTIFVVVFGILTSTVVMACGNAARPVLCGGCQVMGIPTAIGLMSPTWLVTGSGAQPFINGANWKTHVVDVRIGITCRLCGKSASAGTITGTPRTG
jgi:hypothetical protein